MRDRSHRRFNPLLREWVLVSPHRLSRPWQGRTEAPPGERRPKYDPTCYLCPGNERANNARNPQYEATFVFDNDFPALTMDAGSTNPRTDGPTDRRTQGPKDLRTQGPRDLLLAQRERGICRVVCFSPRHDLSVPQLSTEEMQRVVAVWTEQYKDLSSHPDLTYVQIFENRGEAMGASNPHPHCQIWATEHVPDVPRREADVFLHHSSAHHECLLCSYLATEQQAQERLVAENEYFLAIVPFWGVWPFELLVLPRRHVTGMDLLSDSERDGFAAILQDVTQRLDRLFDSPCPYSMGIHQRPADGQPHGESHLHAHFYPPVLRSATVYKFMVGFELLGNPQRDLTPETAAERLREVKGVSEMRVQE
jgi:UDPglucose--hexose-1-phosphate uridylyltransferase